MCKMIRKKDEVARKGFTLIELSFSLVFISILSLAVVFVIISTIKTYSRGVLLNRVNTVGMELVDDMRYSVQGSLAESLVNKCESVFSDKPESIGKCKLDNGKKLVSVYGSASVKLGDTVEIGETVPVFGAFCSGEYSYIWKSGYLAAGNGYSIDPGVGNISLKYRKGDSDGIFSVDNFNLLKVHDTERAVCSSSIGDNYDSAEISSQFDISDEKYMAVDIDPVVLLGTGENSNLVLYNLSSSLPAVSGAGNIMFYAVSFVLGSVQGGINVNTSSNFCSTSGEEGENLDFCSVNKFNFAAMATGR